MAAALHMHSLGDGQARGLLPWLSWKGSATVASVAGLSALLALLLLWSNGSLMMGGAFIVLLVFVAGSLYRIDLGFYMLVGSCLVFGQFEVPGFTTLTYRVSYFRNLKEIPYIPYFSRGDMNVFELHFLFLISLWLLYLVLNRQARLRAVPLWFAWVMWYGWMAFGFIYGMQRGGETMPALWESRSLVYLGLLFLFVPQVISTPGHVKALVWTLIAGVSVKAFEGIDRYIQNGWSTLGTEAMMAHEDPMFIAAVLLFGVTLAIFRTGKAQRVVISLLTAPLLMGFYVGQRRAAYSSSIISLIALLVMLPRQYLMRGLKVVAPFAVLAVIYGVVFWDSSSSLAGPIQKIKSGFSENEENSDVVKDRNYYSNLYRKIEDYDLAITIQSNPVLGIGFGTKYDQPLELARLDFALRDYMAHNNVLWLFAKVGAAGFFIFWLFLNGIAFRGASLMSRLTDPYLQAVCALIVFSIINTMSIAFFDLHIVRYRTMILMGVMMGLVGALEGIEREMSGRKGNAAPVRS